MRVVHGRILKTVSVVRQTIHRRNTRDKRIPVGDRVGNRHLVITEARQATRLLATQCLIMLTQTELRVVPSSEKVVPVGLTPARQSPEPRLAVKY